MTDGSLVSDYRNYIGYLGMGNFIQSGGVHNVEDLYLGYHSGSNGCYDISESAQLKAYSLLIGISGTGTFTQSAGTYVEITDYHPGSFLLGRDVGAYGTYNMTGGNITAPGAVIGSKGEGVFNQSGGVVTMSSWYPMGGGSLKIGNYSGSNGKYNLSGSGQVSSETLRVGSLGNGTFTQSGNSINSVSNQLYLGYTAGSNGTYNLSDAGCLSASEEYVGYDSGATALFQQSGGTNTTNYLSVGVLGEYRLSGGTLQINSGLENKGTFDFCYGPGNIVAANSIVDFSKGVLQNVASASIALDNNSLLIISPGFDPAACFAEYSNAGMTHVAGTTLTVPAGKGFGGSGTIVDPVVCQGTIAASSTWNKGINLSGGLTLSEGSIALGYGTLTTNDTGSSMSGGSMSAYQHLIGSGGVGVFTQTGGTNSSSSYIRLGNNAGDNGTYTLGGNGIISGKYLYVGHAGTGTFNQSGGTVLLSNPNSTGGGTLFLGYESGGSGTYNLNGGTLILSTIRKKDGTAIFNFGGGTLRATDWELSVSVPMTLTGIGGDAKVDTAGKYGIFSGQLSGPGGLVKQGEGTLRLHASNSYTGNTSVHAGTLQALSPSVLPNYSINGKVAVYNGAVLAVNYGGADEWEATNVAALLQAADFQSGSYIGFYTDNATSGATYGNAITGNIGVVKRGQYPLTLSVANTFYGDTKAMSGILILGNVNALQNSTLDYEYANYGGHLNFGSLRSANLGGLKGNQDLVLNNANNDSVALSVGGNDASTTYSGALSGKGSLTKTGLGTLTLSGQSTHTGGTTLAAGQLNINNLPALGTGTFTIAGVSTIDNTSGTTVTLYTNNAQAWNANFAFVGSNNLNLGNGAVTLGGNRIVTVSANELTVGGAIEGDYSLTKAGSGTLTLSSDNTYTGGTILGAGRLNIKNAKALGTGRFTVAGPSTIGNTSGSPITLSNNNAQSWNADFTFAGGSDLDLGNGVVTLGGNRLVAVSANTLTVGGVIGGDYSLTKAGTGTLALGGANAYTGNTTIGAGTLKLGSEASLASSMIGVAAGATFDVAAVSGGYNLTAGQTLNGAGAVSGDITINGIHAPGYSPGIQTIEGDYNMFGELQIELAGTVPGADYDQVLLSGSGDYNATLGGTLTLDWTDFGDSSEETQMWIVQNDTNGILSGEFDDYANGSWLGVHDDLEWLIWYGADAASGGLSGGNDVLISAVPEPSMLVLIGIAAIALSANALRRRKLKSPITQNEGSRTMSHRYKEILVFCLPCVLFFGFVPASQADDRDWVGDTGNWFDAANWWDGIRPTTGDYAYINNGGTACITLTDETCRNLYLGSSVSEAGTLDITGGSLISFLEYIGDQGSGTVTQSDGYHRPGYLLTLGYSANGVGNYTLSGGTLNIGIPGYQSGMANGRIGYDGTGHFTQSGGNHYIRDSLGLGCNQGSIGTYDLQDGFLSLGKFEIIGDGGYGSFTQSGGLNCAYLGILIGNNQGGSGTFEISGGRLWVGSFYSRIGGYGTGTFTQTGGLVEVDTSQFYLGHSPGSSGTYNLNGGTLVISSIMQGEGAATFNFGGGTLKASGALNTSLPMTLTGAGGNANVDTNGQAVTLAGQLSGSGGLNKLGAGTLTLSAANGYTGPTAINTGTLKLGSTASLASSTIDVGDGTTFDVSAVSGGYSLGAGQTLKGSGTVVGDVTIDGIHAPGNSPGIQTIEGDYNMLGELQIELAGTTAGTGYDQVLLCGTGDYDATLGGTLSLDWTDFADSTDETQLWIVENDTAGSLNSTFSNYANGSSLGEYDGRQWWLFYGADAEAGALTGGNDVLISAVPEPSTIALLGFAVIAVSGYALRRRCLSRFLRNHQ